MNREQTTIRLPSELKEEVKGFTKRSSASLYLLTLDERGIPCLDGEKLAGVMSYSIDVDDLAAATLTVTLSVRLDPEVGFDGGVETPGF